MVVLDATGAAAKDRLESGQLAAIEVVRRCFEAAGVEFISENGGGPGVRLRKP